MPSNKLKPFDINTQIIDNIKDGRKIIKDKLNRSSRSFQDSQEMNTHSHHNKINAKDSENSILKKYIYLLYYIHYLNTVL